LFLRLLEEAAVQPLRLSYGSGFSFAARNNKTKYSFVIARIEQILSGARSQ
jgi:hypothetical protein